MKVRFERQQHGPGWDYWTWIFDGIHGRWYTRRSSAKRGFERFVRHISGKGRA